VRVEAVLLDIDGTLMDSNDAHANAWVDVGREFGYSISFDEVRWLIGMGGDKVLPRLTGLLDDTEEGKLLLERRGEIFRKRYLPQLRAFPGARELLERLRADGLRLVVATSASEEDLKALLKQGNIEDVIQATTNADEAEESKPSPDIINAALKKSKAHPDNVIMLGDTPYDVEAALRAGIPTVAVRCGGWTDAELGGAIAVYQDPQDLLRNYESSPLSR
jgi:HAD superfamily hydrolase (TIGR01509 family)